MIFPSQKEDRTAIQILQIYKNVGRSFSQVRNRFGKFSRLADEVLNSLPDATFLAG